MQRQHHQNDYMFWQDLLYQVPLAVKAAEPIITINAHHNTSMVTSDDITSMLIPPELSELTPLSEATTEPHTNDSMATTGTDTPDSPLSRVEDELLDSITVKNALKDSSPQVEVEDIEITFHEDVCTLQEDALNDKDALLQVKVEEAKITFHEDAHTLQEDALNDKDALLQVKVEDVKITFPEEAFTLQEDALNDEDALP